MRDINKYEIDYVLSQTQVGVKLVIGHKSGKKKEERHKKEILVHPKLKTTSSLLQLQILL